MLPFAIVGSEKSVVIDGKAVRGRKNRWGVINVEDERHCEFVYLRNFLTRYVFISMYSWDRSVHASASVCPQDDSIADLNRTHLQDLIETTSQIHYETFRSKQLMALKESSAKQAQQQSSA